MGDEAGGNGKSMSTTTNAPAQGELLNVLQLIGSGSGLVEPRWTPQGDSAYVYLVDEKRIDGDTLETLAQSDLLERIFVERISRCPSCRSHVLNMREICTACRSPRVYPVELLHHYRCGYVAPAYEFEPEAEGRRCPKCYGILRDRGTDHDVPGPHFSCQSCNRSFQLPEIGGVCLACGETLSTAADLERIFFEDVWAYKITSFGSAALRTGDLRRAETDHLREHDLPLFRRSVILEYLEDERRRDKRFHSKFSVLLLSIRRPEHQNPENDERALLSAIAEHLTETDKLGRYDAQHYIAILPSTDSRSAEKLAKKLSSSNVSVMQDWGLGAQVIALSGGALLNELHASPTGAN
jgi:GGDEF domain-containing protein